MKTSILNEFLVLEKHVSFSKAAKELSINQSALSRHIQQLEEELGVPLFQRSTQKIRLTPYGKALLPHAQAVLEHCRAFALQAEELKRQAPGHLSLGICGFPNHYGITTLLAGFKKRNPKTLLDVRTGSTDECIRWLQNESIHAAFVHNITDLTQEFEVTPVCADHISVALPRDHPLAGRDFVALEDLRDEVFYFRHSKDTLTDRFEMKLLRGAGFEPRRSPNRGTWDDSVINRGREISLVMQGLAEKLRGNLHLWVADVLPRVPTDVCLILPRGRQPTDATSAFARFVCGNAPLSAQA